MNEKTIPTHIAIIMDGNRRWARKRGLPTQLGHSQGAKTLEDIAVACQNRGIKYLTVFAFSTENWKRSKEEVDYLMDLLAKNISDFDKRFDNRNVRIKLVGDKNGLPTKLLEGILAIEERTKMNDGLTVNVAINYGGRSEIVNATQKIVEDLKNGILNSETKIDESLLTKYMYTKLDPDPDLLIRTAGETRTSGFLTWQSVYSELYFTDVLWPDFNEKELDKAIDEYNHRKRNFGK